MTHRPPDTGHPASLSLHCSLSAVKKRACGRCCKQQHPPRREDNDLTATVYAHTTERIGEKLQQATIPWQKPWNSAAGLPRNLSSQKPYRGINIWMLGSAGYSS